MTKAQLLYLEKLLGRVTPQDEPVAKALAYVRKDLAEYDARRGQLLDQRSYEYSPW